jgi:hypothetical protein
MMLFLCISIKKVENLVTLSLSVRTVNNYRPQGQGSYGALVYRRTTSLCLENTSPPQPPGHSHIRSNPHPSYQYDIHTSFSTQWRDGLMAAHLILMQSPGFEFGLSPDHGELCQFQGGGLPPPMPEYRNRPYFGHFFTLPQIFDVN